MVEITIINRLQELSQTYNTFESLKLHPVHIRELGFCLKIQKVLFLVKMLKSTLMDINVVLQENLLI